MLPNTRVLHILQFYLVCLAALIRCRLNIVVKKFGNCDPTVDYPNQFYATFRTVDRHQYVDGNATLRAAIDNDMKSVFTIELLVGKKYVSVMRVEEKHTCSSLHIFFGEFAYDIERNAQLVPGLCPIPTGRYHIHNYLLKFDRITIQDIPFGHLRLMEIGTDKSNKVLGCLLAEVENQTS